MSKFFERETSITDEERIALCDAVENTSSITKLLLILSEHLEHAGSDEIGAEMVADFAIMYAEHEEEKVKETQVSIEHNINYN